MFSEWHAITFQNFKSKLLVADLQATCMYILVVNNRFVDSNSFVFPRISFFESLGCILSSNFCGNSSQLPVSCYLSSVTQRTDFKGLYHSRLIAGFEKLHIILI
jgi:hypothetical protein